MTIAYYAPMKPPTHATPSGDRRMARVLMQAWEQAGHTVELASFFRSYDGGDAGRQKRLKSLGERLAARLIRRYLARPAKHRPDAWFTYHLYHKAPDWLGPRVSAALGIPYLVAEASSAPKQAGGRWDLGHVAAAAAIRHADVVLGFNPDDEAELVPLLGVQGRQISLAPCIQTDFYNPDVQDRSLLRRTLAARHGLDLSQPWLLTVAMMRADQKQKSYAVLAQALGKIKDQPWQILIAGQGPAQAAIKAAFSALEGRVTWLGFQNQSALRDLYAATDIFVWPAVKEAYGMVFLEALASGLPVVAGDAPGVANIVRHARTGLLPAQGDAAAFAAAITHLLNDPALRAEMAVRARADMVNGHSLPVLSATLDGLFQGLMSGRAA